MSLHPGLSSMNNVFKRLLTSANGCCRCFNCKSHLGSGMSLLACPSCHALQPAPPTSPTARCCPDYFRLFALPRRFGVDASKLKESFLRLQERVHPDRAGKGADGAWSAWINRANETLKNPLSRAIYLIERLESETSTGSTGNEERIDNMEERIDLDNEASDRTITIAHVLEVRELLDCTQDTSDIAKLKQENDDRISAVLGRLKSSLDEEKDVQRAKGLVNELRYLQSIDQAIKEKL